MKALGALLLLLAVCQKASSYSAYHGGASGYGGAFSSSYSQTSSSSSSSGKCCALDSWARAHMDEIRQVSNRLRQEYNYMSQGSTTGYSRGYQNPWNENVIHLTGKTAPELDALCRRTSEQLVTDMRKGLLSYDQIASPNFFEWKASSILQEQQELQLPQLIDEGPYEPIDLSGYDEVKSYNFPAEVKVIDGRTYVVHKNCTEATKTSGDGAYENPYVSAVTRNRTVITSNVRPAYIMGSNGDYSSGSLINAGAGVSSYPGVLVQPGSSSTTTVTRKKTVYDWINQNMEPKVMDYNAVVNTNGEWTNLKPAVHIPVDGDHSDVETFSSGSPTYSYPGSTVTIRRYNKTIIRDPYGTETVHGSEQHKKWVDGKLVYDTDRPFGSWSVPKDEEWKREERERFFWFLNQGATTPARLEAWQRQQEERLLAVADRYHTTIEQIHEFHRKEWDRYKILLEQYQKQNNDLTFWQKQERGRLDWLIHQNSITREELERWQRENNDKLAQLAASYRIQVEDLKKWQLNELNRLYVYFNEQNNSMASVPMPMPVPMPVPTPNSDSLYIDEQQRVDELIRSHNRSIEDLQNSIKNDQKKLLDLSNTYKGNVQDMEEWLKNELNRLGGLITDQRNEMTRITSWQSSERDRLEAILREHRGSVGELQSKIDQDRSYLQTLAAKYHVNIEELEKWQRDELARLQKEGQTKFEMDMKNWQEMERARLKDIIKKNDLTIEEFTVTVMNDRKRLEDLAKTTKLQVEEIEEWLKQEVKNFQDEGLLKEVKEQLAAWQLKERNRLQALVRQHELTLEEVQANIKKDQAYLYEMSQKYHVNIEELEKWLKSEVNRLQKEGLFKAEDLKKWQQQERDNILLLVQQNHLTIEEFEKKLLGDRDRLAALSSMYSIQTSELEEWIKKEGERLQSAGLLQIKEQLNNWQKIEHDRLIDLIKQNNLSIEELENKIKQDRVHLNNLAAANQVRVDEIEEWIKKEIKNLQDQGLVDMQKLKDWQTEWRGNLTNMVQERDFTVEEFHKWLLEDRSRLQSLANAHNVQIEEIEQWVKNEENRFVSMGLLKPNEKLTDWQTVERRYLERITQQQYKSTEQLEQRLRQDRELLEQLARQYRVQVEEVEQWMKKELTRLRDHGQLQIDNLTAWQIAERDRLEALSKQNRQWSIEEFEAELKKDRDHMQKMAFLHHTSVEEIEQWINQEVARLQRQGKLNIEQLTVWQQKERERILNLLQQQSSVTAEEFEIKIQNDRRFLFDLAKQYRVGITEVQDYIKKVIEELRTKGKFELEKLQNWQLVEREYIKQVIAEYNNELSTKEYEDKLLKDRAHIVQLSKIYHLDVRQIEQWILAELQRLRKTSEQQFAKLAEWQKAEVERLRQLLRQQQHLTYVDFELQLNQDRARLQKLADQHSTNIDEIEKWLKQQLLNLKTTGQIQVENLTKWQEIEQNNLIENLVKHESFTTLENQLRQDRARLEDLAKRYSVSVEEIESWMNSEVNRLRNSGLLEFEMLKNWQKVTRDRLEDWIKQQHNKASYEDFEEFIKRDKSRLMDIANDYRITVEQMESWVEKEGARLQVLGVLQRPQKIIYHNEYHHSWGNNQPSYPINVHVVDTEEHEEMWQTQTKAHLQAVAQVSPMSYAQFEEYLVKERPRWEQFARQYDITVEEIETWLRASAENLKKQGLIHGSYTVEEWQIDEEAYITKLLNDRLKKQQKWSIEELERQLKNDRDHLQQVANKYHVTVEELELWYNNELKRLLDQRKIISENLVDWQRREKERIFNIVKRRPGITLVEIEEEIFNDKGTWDVLLQNYRVTSAELENWIRNELRRLVNLGLIRDLKADTSYNGWQKQERERLRQIVADITITDEELLTFIAGDTPYQQQLSRIYGCSLDQLAPFQRVEALAMEREGLFDKTQLLKLEAWQESERDRLYNLIKNQNISKKNIKDWRDSSLTNIAMKYGIALTTLKEWQLQEFARLEELARQYKMTLNQLQDFREKELRNLAFIMHKKSTTEGERRRWAESEANRMNVLIRKYNLKQSELTAWRRHLYLLCQGWLPMDFGGYGGHEIGTGSTNGTAYPQQIISKDRGDQPPNIYEENIDSDEPGLLGTTPHSAPIREQPTIKPIYNIPPSPNPSSGVQSGYRYTKKEYEITVPVGVASASASADLTSSQASAAVGVPSYGYHPKFHGMSSMSLTDHGLQQQQQQEVDDFGQQQQVDDFGQQQQVELSWNGKLTEDFGQQQEEDLGQQQQVEHMGSYSSHNNNEKQIQQPEVEISAAASKPAIEVVAEPESDGLWNALKKKTSNFFG